ncbi:uncharacterized protein PHALS_08390 [Plasmopara halstedii]|uniref:Temptin Cys/Cys disulfide domain-containing protein n=1 Tax=Plasmopara halstedii TaxID=4781 RepID=A0A0P1ACA0_PLAHL|nr:uncharacterized protein PHALS_08390 [Plasmopara halstedii]CEG38309.1 hypothetical protein PHALS_08390 [Plasmopara halstedii]|eukprot:XP_024574678.1 hypothetical protein PHALS_08390 [Plasmopara halstedii]
MLTIGQIVVITTAFMQTVSARDEYKNLIPNGPAMGMPLGHEGKGYTLFGSFFSKSGKEWSKVCNQPWPGGSVTCGAALGDPCCTWKSGDPDFKLSEPNLEAAPCASGSQAGGSGSGSAPYSETPGAETPGAETPGAETPIPMEESPVQMDPTTVVDTPIVTDSSEYCE